jgi:hypothetical protein
VFFAANSERGLQKKAKDAAAEVERQFTAAQPATINPASNNNAHLLTSTLLRDSEGHSLARLGCCVQEPLQFSG